MAPLPQTAQDLFRPPPVRRLAWSLLLALSRGLRLWRFPIRAYGEAERLRFIDVWYWLHKARYPVRRARRDSGIEDRLGDPARRQCRLPEGFQPGDEWTLSAVGDLMNHPWLARSADTLYPEVADTIFGADIAMANLECPIVAGRSRDLVIAFDDPASLVFDEAEFAVVRGHAGRCYDLLATACNHSLDEGAAGVDSTLRALAGAGIAQSGLNARAEDAAAGTILDCGGLRLGVVAWTFGLNGRRPPPDRPWLVNRMWLNDGLAGFDEPAFVAQLDWCRARGAEFIVAQLHWGLEFEYWPTPEQIGLAERLADLGVDLILGHHPHVLQPFELLHTSRDGGRQVPVYYSLGNLVNPFSAPWMCRSGVARLKLVRGRSPDGRSAVHVADAGLQEVVQEADPATRQICLRPS